MERTLEIYSLDANNNNIKKTIPNVNPEATDADLYTFSEKCVELTDNTHVAVKKIDTTVLAGE